MFFVGTEYANARSSSKEIGLRFGSSPGIMYRQQLNSNLGFHGLLSFRGRGVQLTGMVAIDRSIGSSSNGELSWFAGGGAHVGFARHANCDRWYVDDGLFINDCKSDEVRPDLGIDGIVGLRYLFDRAPIALSISYKPYINLFSGRFASFNFWDFGIGATYVF